MEDVRFCAEHGFYRGEVCSCGRKGELIVDGEKVEKLSRLMIGILRHFPEKFDLKMDENGWVDFEAFLKAVKRRFKWANRWIVKAIIYSDAKKRYELKGDKIRARYGHSIEVELKDMPEATEDVLYYGTSEEEAQRITEVGIKPVKQTFVHLSTTLEKSIEVAVLRTENPIVFEIDAKKARENGIRIIKANETIALAKEIPPQYILRQIKSA